VALRECFELVLDGYVAACQEEFTQHPLANFIRNDFRDELKNASGENDRLVFKGSAGQGNWARAPWVGVFDQLVTTSAQRGYYAVLLFREDMEGVYLSLNQGMDRGEGALQIRCQDSAESQSCKLQGNARKPNRQVSGTDH
jgi:5-methylcytosine-specific restriction protein A